MAAQALASAGFSVSVPIFALVLIPRDEIWWVPVSEVAGKKSICTNAEKDVLHQYRGNLNPLREWGTQGDTILSTGGQIGGHSKF